jgi:hypothetical protein
LLEWWRLLDQLFRSFKGEAIPVNPDPVAVPPATVAEPFCCWALAMAPRCARAIKMVKDDSAVKTWGVRFHIYKMMSFEKEGEPDPDYLELARFLLYLDGHANYIKLQASAEPNDQPFRDWAEEKALLRSIAGFVPGKCLHRTRLTMHYALPSPPPLRRSSLTSLSVAETGSEDGVVWSGTFGGDVPCVLKLAAGSWDEQLCNECQVLNGPLRYSSGERCAGGFRPQYSAMMMMSMR